MGYDAILGVSLVVLGGAIGFSTGTLNATTTVVAQEIAGLPLYSGLTYRFVCFAVFMVVTDIFLIWYARKVKAIRQLALCMSWAGRVRVKLMLRMRLKEWEA